MHESSMKRMRWFANKYLSKTTQLNILDVGSYNVNGCYKEIFTDLGFKYTGLDMEEGPNVDITPESTYKWSEVEDNFYDATISGQALEHIEFFWITFAEMVRVTREGGLICIIAPNGFREHRYPVDCWRFFTDGMVALARYYQLEIVHAHTNAGPSTEDSHWYSEGEADSMLIAKKTYAGKARTIDLANYECTAADHKKLMGNMYTYSDYKKECLLKERKKVIENNTKAYDQRERYHGRRYKLTKKIRDIIKRIRGQVG